MLHVIHCNSYQRIASDFIMYAFRSERLQRLPILKYHLTRAFGVKADPQAHTDTRFQLNNIFSGFLDVHCDGASV